MTRRWQIETLGVSLEIESHVPALCPDLDAALAGYKRASRQADSAFVFHHDEAGNTVLIHDQEFCFKGSAFDAYDVFSKRFYERIATHPRNELLLHAAALHKEGTTLVLAGPSGSGKSTLTRALLLLDWEYLSEEMVAVSPEGTQGLRRPLHAESADALLGLPQFSDALPQGDAGDRWIAPLQKSGNDKGGAPTLVLLNYRPNAPTQMSSLGAADALQALWSCRMNSGKRVAQTAALLVRARPCYRLQAQDVDGAVSACIKISDGHLGRVPVPSPL